MALDEVHEQNNKAIKSTGGATDLVNKRDDSPLIRWETCVPDIARIITGFEESEGKPLAKSTLLQNTMRIMIFSLKFLNMTSKQ